MKWNQLVLVLMLGGSLGTMAQPSTAPDSPAPDVAAAVVLTPGLQQLVNLAESGTSQDSLLAFITSYPQRFDATADMMFYLRDQGINSTVIDAVLTHDKNMTPGALTNPYARTPYATAPAPAPVPVSTIEPPAAPPTIYQPLPQPAYVTDAPEDVTYFYDSLNPYGTWINLDGYGWCWQPRTVVIDHTWQPYCDGGRWVNTDAGWCWKSDYSWGWAPFHYGRWHQHPGIGWVWFPDRTWGPGWVTWRNDDVHCGWAPLPWRCEVLAGGGYRYNGVTVGVNFDFGLGVDAFTFISIGNFAAHDYHHYRIEPERCRDFFPRTVVINNIHEDRDHGFVNRGIDRSRIEAATHHTFKTVEIREETHANGLPHFGSGSVVYRRDLVKPEVHSDIRAQVVDSHHTQIQHEQFNSPRAQAPVIPQMHPNNAPQAPAVHNYTAPTHPAQPQPQQPSQPQQQPRRPRQSDSPGSENNRNNPPHASSGNSFVTPPTIPQTAANTPETRPVVHEAPRQSQPVPAVVQSYQNANAQHYVPMHNVVGSQGAPVANSVPNQQYSSHEYYPKTFRQSVDSTPAAPAALPNPVTFSRPVTQTFQAPQVPQQQFSRPPAPTFQAPQPPPQQQFSRPVIPTIQAQPQQQQQFNQAAAQVHQSAPSIPQAQPVQQHVSAPAAPVQPQSAPQQSQPSGGHQGGGRNGQQDNPRH